MSHAHGHNHGRANYSKSFALGRALNLGFVLIEASFGVFSHSLLADRNALIDRLSHGLEGMGISHPTIQMEEEDGGHDCHLKPDLVV